MGTPTNVTPPIDDTSRATEQALRDSFWDGTWAKQLESDVKTVLGSTRQEVVGVPDRSCCLGPQFSRELAVCYLAGVDVTRKGRPARLTEDDGPVARALLWSLMPDFQGRVIWLRDYVMRVDATGSGELLFRPVAPYLVEMEPDPAKPDQPIVYREWVPRDVRGESVWTRDVIDLTDPENAVYRVESEDGTEDLTEDAFGKPSMSGEEYPFRWAGAEGKPGLPWMPVELYHRDPDAALWHYTQGAELVSATRMAAVLWSLWVHAYRDGCYEQRVLLDAVVEGKTTPGMSGVAYVNPDVTLILQARSLEGKQGSCQQWRSGADLDKLTAGLQAYIAQAATREGVSPAELQRLSGDPQSGYAIALTNEGKRAAQRRFGPQFKVRDESLLCKAAALWNRHHPDEPQYPEDGYHVSYRSIPLSPAEERAIREQADWELEKGWITAAQALARVRGITEGEAAKVIAANEAATRNPDPPESAEPPEPPEFAAGNPDREAA